MNRRVITVAALLLFALCIRAWVSITPTPPVRRQLAEMPRQVGVWRAIGDTQISDDVANVLKADDSLLRRYVDDKGNTMDLFIAYYKTQKAGESMHSPKNCLPGGGWTPIVNDTIALEPSAAESPRINRYIIEKDQTKAIALYWYQASGRVIASEYSGKFFLVYEALRSGRRDGAIVRITLPLARGEDQERRTEAGRSFAQAIAPILPEFLPR